MRKRPPAAFSPRKHPQRSPEAAPPVLSSPAAELDGLVEHPEVIEFPTPYEIANP